MDTLNNLLNKFKHQNITNPTPKEGFDFSYISYEYNAIRTKRYSISTIQQYLKILHESKNLINNTKNPDVFFSRYLITIAIINELVLVERKINFKGTTPSEIKKQLILKEKYTVNDFLDRFYEDTKSQIAKLKTNIAKQKRIEKFFHGLDNYKQYLNKDSKIKYEQLCNSLI